MNGKKKRHVILIVLAVVVLAAGILGGRELWLYEHPEIQIRFSHDSSEDLYRSYPICSIRSRSHIGQGYAKQYGEELRQYWEATNEVFVWISEQYQKPLYVTSDVTIGDGKTVISFRGTGTSMTTGETEEIHRDCVLDFEMHAEVLRSEEEPELTVTLRDISNIGASIVIRREDEDAGTELTCGEEVSNYYKWDWLYGVLEPGEYRMVYDVFQKTEGAGSAQKYREYIRFQL